MADANSLYSSGCSEDKNALYPVSNRCCPAELEFEIQLLPLATRNPFNNQWKKPTEKDERRNLSDKVSLYPGWRRRRRSKNYIRPSCTQGFNTGSKEYLIWFMIHRFAVSRLLRRGVKRENLLAVFDVSLTFFPPSFFLL